jgi:HPt (histidine-containing phosphotransfer) domain-containing protein
MEFPDLDPKAVQSLMKMGGKKKLDTLIELLKQHGPARVAELKAAKTREEAHAAARALKQSASHLGLAALEDLCDQTLEAREGWNALAEQIAAALQRGLAALSAERARL